MDSTPMLHAAGLDPELAKRVRLCLHPVLQHKLTQLRRRGTSNKHFRELVKEVTWYLGFEASRDLNLEPLVVETPLARHTGSRLKDRVAIVPIMRSGLGMVDSLLTLLPMAKVYHIGLYNNRNSLLPVLYFNKLPLVADVDVAFVLEPQIASGSTALACVEILREWSPSLKIKVITLVASKVGAKNLLEKYPDIELIVLAIDDETPGSGEIFPGIGDAGDRIHNTAEYSATSNSPRAEKNHHLHSVGATAATNSAVDDDQEESYEDQEHDSSASIPEPKRARQA